MNDSMASFIVEKLRSDGIRDVSQLKASIDAGDLTEHSLEKSYGLSRNEAKKVVRLLKEGGCTPTPVACCVIS
jgi:hypothetical protein